jgi:hypothetical protein
MKEKIANFLEKLCDESDFSTIDFYIEAQAAMNKICFEEIYLLAIDLQLHSDWKSERLAEKDCENCSKQIHNDNPPLPDKLGENNPEKEAKNALKLLEQYIQSSN